jgi:transcriptional regulator of arginine metabolism
MKKMRQKAILDLVRNREISSQEELLEKLLAQKIDVSQSTLSRDIMELRLAKSGGVYTVMDGEAAPASDDSARWIMREFLREASIAQNILVLKTDPGNASIVARAIDTAGWKEVVGSIAGDDTVFVVVRTSKDSQELKRRVMDFLK